MPKRKKKYNKLPPFVPLTWDLLNNPAYIALTPSAAKALPYFLGKVKTGFNDPEKYETLFSFSYPEAKSLGLSTATFSRVIRELIRVGFIERVEHGGLRGRGKGYNKFKLSKQWASYQNEESKIILPVKAPTVKENGSTEVKRRGLRKRRRPAICSGLG